MTCFAKTYAKMVFVTFASFANIQLSIPIVNVIALIATKIALAVIALIVPIGCGEVMR